MTRLIHFIWLGSPLSEQHERTLKLFRDLNPGWEIMVHTSLDGLLPEFKACLPAVVADRQWPTLKLQSMLLRHSLLRQYGGFYFDFDCTAAVGCEFALKDAERNYYRKFQVMVAGTDHWLYVDAAFKWPGFDKVMDAARIDPLKAFNNGTGLNIRGYLDGRPETLVIGTGRYFTSNYQRAFGVAVPAQPRSEPTPPTYIDLLGNFTGAVKSWASAGFPTVTHEQYVYRTAVCDICPNWEPNAYLGLGKCKACGCTAFKRWLATERCPLAKWPELGVESERHLQLGKLLHTAELPASAPDSLRAAVAEATAALKKGCSGCAMGSVLTRLGARVIKETDHDLLVRIQQEILDARASVSNVGAKAGSWDQAEIRSAP